MGSSNKTNVLLFLLLVAVVIGIGLFVSPNVFVERDNDKDLPLTSVRGR